jgi:excisionase family DNA binding protein
MEHAQSELVTAAGLEDRGILPKTTAYKMARAGHIPSYAIGTKGRGVRFRVEEVLAALRRPAKAEVQTS